MRGGSRAGRGTLALVGALGALAAVAALPDVGASATSRPAPALRAFAGCPSLLGHFRDRAARLAGPWGLRGYATTVVGDVRRGIVPVAPEAAAGAPLTPGVDFSGTNVQEAGVDEPDSVKTDGTRMFTVAGGRLHALDVSGATARRLGSLPLAGGSGATLLLAGDRLLVLESGGYAVGPEPAVAIAPASTTTLTAIDVSDPSAMRPVGTIRVDGDLVSARLTGTTIRAVVASRPEGPELLPPASGDPGALADAAARNRRRMAASGLGDWMPRYTLRRPGRATVRRLAAPCDQVRAPARFAGLGMVSVLTLGLEPGLAVLDSDAVMTDASEVYASTSSLYLATPRWHDPASESRVQTLPAGLTTLIHKLDISDPRSTTYRASGAVPGHLLSQWAMSEHEGVLRAASTDVPSWWAGDPRRDSESFVTALAERDGRLVRVGGVGGIGRGERIYAVRFMGTLGYVVTFRQTDPLFVVDVSDPTRPAVRGELELPGYSAYLHPVGDGVLLGVGQDATAEGRVLGTQVSLFDVSDPARPTRVRHLSLGRGWSEAESDHHAFLYWAGTGLLVLPFEGEGGFSGAVGLRVAPGAPIAEVGRVSHPGGQADGEPVRRSLVVGSTLYTVSERGVMASALDTLAPRGWTPLA